MLKGTAGSLFFLYLFFLLLPCIGFSQGFHASDKVLERKIFVLNNAGKYIESEKILLEILTDSQSDDHQKWKAGILLSNTYKRLFDYTSAENYLNEAQKYAATDAEKNILQSLYTMVYFDTHQYSTAKKIMQKLEAEKFKGIDAEDQAILLMQDGYLEFLAEKYSAAEKLYGESLKVMDHSNSCNQPIVYAKLLTLYAAQGRNSEIKPLYEKGIARAKACKIMKYEIYLTEEVIKTLPANDFENIARYRTLLDTLNKQYEAAENIAKLNSVNTGVLKKNLQTVENKAFYYRAGTIISAAVTVLLALIAFRFYQRRKLAEKNFAEVQRTFDFYANNLTVKEEGRLEELIQEGVFSERQEKILQFLLAGMNNNTIAERLFISENTVKYHIKNIYKILADNNVKFERFKSENINSNKSQISATRAS